MAAVVTAGVAWAGMEACPRVLTAERIAALARDLLGTQIDDVARLAAREFTLTGSTGAGSVFVHSATPAKRCFEADLLALRNGVRPEHPAGYIEARSIFLARSADVVVGRLPSWRAAVDRRTDLIVADIGDTDHYYLTHALLVLAERHEPAVPDPLGPLLQAVRERPGTVVRVYALDLETQIFLLWLRRVAGVDRLLVDANSPAVTEDWNQKAVLHPTVRRAADLGASADPFDLLRAESAITALGERAHVAVPRLPGYTVERAGPLAEQVRLAADLLTTRYGLTHGCLKPARTGTGVRIRPGVPLGDARALGEVTAAIEASDEDHVLEAQASYLTCAVGGVHFQAAPSAHIADGTVEPGITMQLLEGVAWRGNVLLDESRAAVFGLDADHYRAILETTAALVDGIGGVGPEVELIKGGIDYALARVGGHFGDEVLFAVQDLNLCSHGAEFVRAFAARMPRSQLCAATRVVRPQEKTDLDALATAVAENGGGTHCEAITSVPGRWGMIAVAAEDPAAAVRKLVDIEGSLRDHAIVH